MYQAGYQPYDDNIATLLLALVIAFGVYIALGIYWLRRREEWRKWIIDLLLLSVMGSPMTIFWVAGHYKAIFGVVLQV